jgi:hypothetical protein
MFHLKRNHITHERLHPRNVETSDNTECSQPCPRVLSGLLLGISTAVISVALSLNEILSQTLPVSTSVVTSLCTVVVFGTSFSGYALLNAPRRGANDFDTPCWHLNRSCATRKSSGLVTRTTLICVTWEVGRVYYTAVNCP